MIGKQTCAYCTKATCLALRPGSRRLSFSAFRDRINTSAALQLCPSAIFKTSRSGSRHAWQTGLNINNVQACCQTAAAAASAAHEPTAKDVSNSYVQWTQARLAWQTGQNISNVQACCHAAAASAVMKVPQSYSHAQLPAQCSAPQTSARLRNGRQATLTHYGRACCCCCCLLLLLLLLLLQARPSDPISHPGALTHSRHEEALHKNGA